MKTGLVRLLLTLAAHLPWRINHGLGSCLGRLLLHSNNAQRRIARINLTHCFPDLGAEELQRLLRHTLIETGKLFFETGKLWLDNDILSLVREVHGEEHLQQGLARGKGVILAAPHLGNWEILGPYVSVRHPMTCLYRPPRMTGLDRMIRQARGRFGAKLAPTTAKGVRALYQALANNEVVAILPDQDPRDSGGRFAPFFGIQANTMTLLSRLVNKSNATVLCCYAERLPDSRGFNLYFEPAPAELYAGDVATSVTALNQMVEQAVRRLPAQYQWGYRRFLTRPEGEVDFYDEA